MRIENPMATFKTQDMTADRIKDARAQALNPMMEHEEDKLRDEEMNRTQALEEAQYNRIEENKRQQQEGHKGGKKKEDEKEEPLSPEELEEAELLRQEAAERLLRLPVDAGKFAHKEERRIDLRL